MAKNEDSSDKTEKPTRKRLRDARKKGDVPKSKELTSTIMVLGWLLLLALMGPYVFGRLDELFEQTLRAAADRQVALWVMPLAQEAAWLLLIVLAIALVAAFTLAAACEFLQVGPIFAAEKAKPDIERLNPAEGTKKMFSQDNLVELAKSFLKTIAVTGIVVLVLFSYLDEILKLVYAPAARMMSMYWHVVFVAGVWIVLLFAFVSVLDFLYQRYAFEKKLRMSRRDIRQELKDDEGDPYVKQRRRQLHFEWSQRNTLEAVRTSSAVVTNPTHLAIAILYDPQETVVPVVAAKGEDYLAQLIKETAIEAGVPVMENVALARTLYEQVEVDDYVPEETFEAVAQVLRWAENQRRLMAGER